MTYSVEASTNPDEPHDYRYTLSRHIDKHYESITISDAGLTIMGDLLDFERTTYGDPAKETFLGYHNDRHSYTVFAIDFWVLNFMKTTLKRPLIDRDFELSGIAATAHDSVQETYRSDNEYLAFHFPDGDITLANDTDKSDEQISAELAVALMRRQNINASEQLYTMEDQRRVYTAVRTTEYARIGKDISLKNIARTVRDPAAIALIIADTGSIFAGGEKAMIRDVGNLSLELLGNDLSDPHKVIETVTNLVEFQKKFLLGRAAEYTALMRGLIEGSEESDSIFSTMIQKLSPRYDSTITLADSVGSHIGAFREAFEKEFDKAKTLDPSKKISTAITNAFKYLSSDEQLPKDTI